MLADANKNLSAPFGISLVVHTPVAGDLVPGETLLLGASRWQMALAIIREARFAVMAAVILAFGRAISEVGLAMMVGGNIRGFTRVLTTAISLESSKGDIELSLALGIILIVIALVINIIMNRINADYFLGGIIAYSNDIKIDTLGVPKKIIERIRGCQRANCESMAQGVRKITGASIGISATGIAGPGGGKRTKPVGWFFLALPIIGESKPLNSRCPAPATSSSAAPLKRLSISSAGVPVCPAPPLTSPYFCSHLRI
jgi:hypothetical protein